MLPFSIGINERRQRYMLTRAPPVPVQSHFDIALNAPRWSRESERGLMHPSTRWIPSCTHAAHARAFSLLAQPKLASACPAQPQVRKRRRRALSSFCLWTWEKPVRFRCSAGALHPPERGACEIRVRMGRNLYRSGRRRAPRTPRLLRQRCAVRYSSTKMEAPLRRGGIG